MSSPPLHPLDRHHLKASICYAIKSSRLVMKVKPAPGELVGDAMDRIVSDLVDDILARFDNARWVVMAPPTSQGFNPLR